MNEIIIKTEFIKLQQLLKLAGIVGQGSDAKLYIKNGEIKVNGITATQRGKKIYHGDIITIRNIGELKILQKQ
ncbi:MAG: RNA-binding S4 domain-containing protein [Firmicutes bacterium]|jgi:ribosome-associated protein|nr:RNA-binding S4 domain-containing protein [Bacillota bacterium]